MCHFQVWILYTQREFPGKPSGFTGVLCTAYTNPKISWFLSIGEESNYFGEVVDIECFM
jgi:hypothetical protein